MVAGPSFVHSQELPPPEEPPESIPEEGEPPAEPPPPGVSGEDFLVDPDLPFTGTLADDDPENMEAQEDRELFGDEEILEEEKPAATHSLKFEFTSRVQFAEQVRSEEDNSPTSPPYMEIEYRTDFEIPVNLGETRIVEETEANFQINNWGSLFRNEFSDCRLEIAVEKMPVEIVTRSQKKEALEENEEGEEPRSSLAVKITFSREIKEDWFSLCTDTSGATLNTQGAPEDYNLRILNAVEPSLKAIVIDEFDPSETTMIPLTTPPNTINDPDIANDIILSGEGKIVLEPL